MTDHDIEIQFPPVRHRAVAAERQRQPLGRTVPMTYAAHDGLEDQGRHLPWGRRPLVAEDRVPVQSYPLESEQVAAQKVQRIEPEVSAMACVVNVAGIALAWLLDQKRFLAWLAGWVAFVAACRLMAGAA